MAHSANRPESGVDRFGLLRIGQVQMAVAATALLEIVPRGAKLHSCPLPSLKGVQVRGTLLHRGAAVPILDISEWVGTKRDAGEETGAIGPIAIIRSADTLVGVVIDEAVRVSDPGTSAVIELQGEIVEAGLFRSYLRDAQQVSFILEPGALVKRLSSQTATAGKREVPSDAKQRKGERALIAVVRWGTYVFGIRSQWVISAMPACPLQETGMDDTLVRGFLPFNQERNRTVAVVNLAPLLKLPEQEPAEKPAQYLLLGDEQRRVAVGITSVCGLDYVEVDHLDPIQLQGVLGTGLFEGALFSKRYGQMLILNGEGILGAPPLKGMVNPPPPPKVQELESYGLEQEEWEISEEKVEVQEVAGEPCTFVVYRAAQSFYATPTSDLDGILLKPQLQARLGHTHDAMEGFIHWRGASVPVLNLTRCLGFESPTLKPPSEWVLIHRKGASLIGFLVEGVDSLTLAAPTLIPAQVAERRDHSVRLSTPIPPPCRAISFKDGKGSRTAFVLDLGMMEGSEGVDVGVAMGSGDRMA